MVASNNFAKTESAVREIEAGKASLTFLLGRMFHPQVICSTPDATCRRISDTILFLKRNLMTEEKFMIDAGYPDFSAHKREHEKLLQYLNRKKESLICNNYENREISEYFLDWRKHHSIAFDGSFDKFIKNRK